MKEESLAGPAVLWMAQTQGGTGSLSSLLALARDLHTFLWESIKEHNKERKRLMHYWKSPFQDLKKLH